MTLSPLSRSSVCCPSTPRTSSAEPLSTPTRGLPDIQGTQNNNSLQQFLQSDGFDSPVGTNMVGGLKAMEQVLAQMMQVLDISTQLLGTEGGDVGRGVPEIGGTAGSAPKTGNTMTFTNDGNSPMTIQFTPNAGEKAIPPLTLEPGRNQTVEFPKGWSGNFRSTSGDGAAATLGEVKFNGGGDQTYYDVSYIEGDNAAMTIKPQSGGRQSGTTDNLLASAPDSVKAKDANGSVYGIKKTTTSNVQDQAVVDFYRKHVGADEGYVIPTDDASTLGTKDTHLEVHMKNLV